MKRVRPWGCPYQAMGAVARWAAVVSVAAAQNVTLVRWDAARRATNASRWADDARVNSRKTKAGAPHECFRVREFVPRASPARFPSHTPGARRVGWFMSMSRRPRPKTRSATRRGRDGSRRRRGFQTRRRTRAAAT